MIAFDVDGNIITANDNFLGAMGYTLGEIKGKHHSMFVEPSERASAGYQDFWARLKRGEFQAAEFKRIGKNGKEVWILATYNPITDEKGIPFKVVKYATDVTAQKLKAADLGGQIAAITKSQAVIEFRMDGTILDANPNFLTTLGYSLDEIRGRHHSMFVEPADRDSADYREFWARLNRGEYQAAEYKRIGKGGREVWIQASYNPILDLNGKPFKVVKFATDITACAGHARRARPRADRIGRRRQRANDAIDPGDFRNHGPLRKTAADAVTQVESADHQAQRLTEAAASMQGIVGMIGDITSQINLLALNATIESARAGEAGRGFAVVAGEVKNLANQAKPATDKITTEIAALTGISSDVVSALSVIRGAIDHVNEFVASTAAAVEEQSAVTADMSTNMQKASAELAG